MRTSLLALAGLAALAPLALGCAETTPRHARRPRAYIPSRQWIEPPPDPGPAAAISFAEAQVGKRYCWGGTGPSCFDCSGLVQAAWRWAGARLPRTSRQQGEKLEEVPLSEIRPGDVLWWHGHVGLYVGAGTMIDAYHSGAGVVRRRAPLPERVLRVASPAPAPVHRWGWASAPPPPAPL